jgi:hypothetical protein
VEVFTAGALSTQRNEGINKHSKRTLSKNSVVGKVIKDLNIRDDLQEERTRFADLQGSVPYKEQGSAVRTHFGLVYDAMKESCSDFGIGMLIQQAGRGLTDYNVTASFNDVCNESEWEATDIICGQPLPSLDICDAARYASVTELVDEHNIKEFVCYVVTPKATLSVNASPQFVVLHDKHEDGNHFNNFFYTCGCSSRFGSACRHFFSVLSMSSLATFHLGMVHDSWFKVCHINMPVVVLLSCFA